MQTDKGLEFLFRAVIIPDNTHRQLAECIIHICWLEYGRFIIGPLVDADGLYIFMFAAMGGKNL